MQMLPFRLVPVCVTANNIFSLKNMRYRHILDDIGSFEYPASVIALDNRILLNLNFKIHCFEIAFF